MIKKGRENIHVISNSRIHTTCWNTATRAQARTRCVACENIPMISYSRIHTTYWHPAHTYHLLTHCNHLLTPYTHIPLTVPAHTHNLLTPCAHAQAPNEICIGGNIHTRSSTWIHIPPTDTLHPHTTYWHPTHTYHLKYTYDTIQLNTCTKRAV